MVPELDLKQTFGTLLPKNPKPERNNPTFLVPELDPNPTFATRLHHYHNHYYLLLQDNKQTEAKCANEDNCKDELFQLTAQLACAQEEIHFLESLLRRASKSNNQLIHSSRNINSESGNNCIKHIVPTNNLEQQDSIILNNKAMDKKQHIKQRKR